MRVYVMNNKLSRPPLGIIPKKLHDEIVNKRRLNELCRAISEYYNTGLEIKLDWIIEYNDLIKVLFPRKSATKSTLMQIALDWWNNLAIKDVEECRNVLDTLVHDYYPEKRNSQDMTNEEILYIYIEETNL